MARTDLNALAVFAALYTELNATRAAEKLGITQSAVSHALKGLRDRLGDRLFERTAQGLRPTPRAQQLASRVLEAVHLADEVLGSGKDLGKAISRTLYVSMSDHGVALFMPSLAHWLRDAYPDVDLRVVGLSRADAVKRIEQRELDIAVGAFPGIESPRTP